MGKDQKPTREELHRAEQFAKEMIQKNPDPDSQFVYGLIGAHCQEQLDQDNVNR